MRALRDGGGPGAGRELRRRPRQPIVRLAGAAGEGSVHTYAGTDPMANSASSELVRRCREALGEVPSYVVECYDAVQVIAAALRGGASNRAEVREAIAATDIEGIGGRIRFDSNGDRVDAPVSLWTIRGGRMEALSSSNGLS